MLKKAKIYQLFLLLSFFNFINSSLKFNIASFKDRCFQTEIYVEGSLMIRYDLTGFENFFRGKEQEDLFKNIKIFIRNEKGLNIYETSLKSRKDKFVVHIKEAQVYQICTRYFKPRGGRELPGFIMMGLKIRNDYVSEEVEESLHREDVNKFWRKIRNIKKDMKPSIDSAKLELEEEDKTAKSMISSINIYYRLCAIQLVIIVIVTMYIIITFQDFFKKNSII